ncbi:MAG: SMC-Scp complex subunit ScpB [Syntrophobacterales bacterium]|nr:SMC-Scp complex subunit ScpB [Syntrophobacterales bacterium]
MENLKAIVEALIFASETPLTLEKLTAVLEEVEKKTIRACLEELVAEYDGETKGFYLAEVAGGYHFRTRNEWSGWVQRLKKGKPATLSAVMLEALAITAYRQPVLKAEIDSIRGVDSGGTIRKLLEKKLIRIVGRKDVPGHPILYGTTQRFLDVFNLKDLSELPTLRELKELQE